MILELTTESIMDEQRDRLEELIYKAYSRKMDMSDVSFFYVKKTGLPVMVKADREAAIWGNVFFLNLNNEIEEIYYMSECGILYTFDYLCEIYDSMHDEDKKKFDIILNKKLS